MLNPGKLNRKIEIHGKIEFENAVGEISTRNGLIKKVWAQIIPQTGALQRQQADTILTNVTHKIVVRYSAGRDIKHDMEIYYKNRKYEIRYILNPFESNEVFEIFVQEVLG